MSIIFSIIFTIYLIVSSYVKIQVFTCALVTMSLAMPFVLSFLLLGYATYVNFDLVLFDVDLFSRLLSLEGFAYKQ